MWEIFKNFMKPIICNFKEYEQTITNLHDDVYNIKQENRLKDEIIAALNIKLNTYTMDYNTLLEKMESKIYLYDPKDITLEPGVKIELMDLVKLMKTYGATAFTYIDSYYFSIEPELVTTILKHNKAIDKSNYIAEDHDCDDFAFALQGLFSQEELSGYAFGWARSSNHAFNFFIDKNKEIWIVEPQNSNIMKYSDILNKPINSNGQENNIDYKITQYLI